MKNSDRSRQIAVICAFSIAICLLVMCLQVERGGFSAIAENSVARDVIYANAEISDGLSLKEKLAEDSSLWGRLARAIWNIVEPWSP